MFQRLDIEFGKGHLQLCAFQLASQWKQVISFTFPPLYYRGITYEKERVSVRKKSVLSLNKYVILEVNYFTTLSKY